MNLAPSPNKYALVIGINYTKTNQALHGCHNDAYQIKNLLLTKFHFKSENIVLMLDEDKVDSNLFPTHDNIIKQIRKLSAKPPGQYWFNYSGHGYQISDQKNECIVPIDYDTKGIICDNLLRKLLIRPLKKKGRLNILMDCCNSGSILDLKNRFYVNYNSDQKEFQHNSNIKKKNKKKNYAVTCLSGCLDHQKGIDIYVPELELHMGVLTFSYIKTLHDFNFQITLKELIKSISTYFYSNNIKQIPQISYNKPHLLNKPYVGDKMSINKSIYTNPNVHFFISSGLNSYQNSLFNIHRNNKKILHTDRKIQLNKENFVVSLRLTKGKYNIIFSQITDTIHINCLVGDKEILSSDFNSGNMKLEFYIP